MAILPDKDRMAVWAEFMSDKSRAREALGNLSKQDLRAAADALDDFMNAHAADINAALPQPARSEMTVGDKARLLMLVVARRWLRET